MSMVHPMARTTPRTRAEIHDSGASVVELARTYNISHSTARKWRDRDDQLDRSHKAHQLHTTLSAAQELIVMDIRRLCLLPLDDRSHLSAHAFEFLDEGGYFLEHALFFA